MTKKEIEIEIEVATSILRDNMSLNTDSYLEQMPDLKDWIIIAMHEYAEHYHEQQLKIKRS